MLKNTVAYSSFRKEVEYITMDTKIIENTIDIVSYKTQS
jgi:hypothetical protein